MGPGGNFERETVLKGENDEADKWFSFARSGGLLVYRVANELNFSQTARGEARLGVFRK